jgi:hypothetical protein
MAAAFNTEPATAEFMKFLTTVETGNVAAETGVFTSPLKAVDAGKSAALPKFEQGVKDAWEQEASS